MATEDLVERLRKAAAEAAAYITEDDDPGPYGVVLAERIHAAIAALDDAARAAAPSEMFPNPEHRYIDGDHAWWLCDPPCPNPVPPAPDRAGRFPDSNLQDDDYGGHEGHEAFMSRGLCNHPSHAAPDRAGLRERYGWHGDGDRCLGPECLNTDENTGNHDTDVHSEEWWDGFTEAGRRIALIDSEGLDVERLAALASAFYGKDDGPEIAEYIRARLTKEPSDD